MTAGGIGMSRVWGGTRFGNASFLKFLRWKCSRIHPISGMWASAVESVVNALFVTKTWKEHDTVAP